MRRTTLLIVAMGAMLLMYAGGALAQSATLSNEKMLISNFTDKHIYSMYPDGSGKQDLGVGFSSAISHNGKKIAFSSAGDIWVMNADGTGKTNLTKTSGMREVFPVWFPDDTKIAYEEHRDTWADYSDIWTMNANGTGKTNLTNTPTRVPYPESLVDVFPDGQKILYTSAKDIWTMNVNGTGKTNLTKTPDHEYSADLFPDGKKIAYSKSLYYSDDYWSGDEIWVMNADGAGRTNIVAANAFSIYDLEVAPDSSKIAFSMRRSILRSEDITVVNVDGSGMRNLTSNMGSTDEHSPQWSPDATKIAFTSDTGTPQTRAADLWTMNANGLGQTNLTNSAGEYDFLDDWGPPLKDSDGDGALKDNCPNTPNSDQEDVDEDGKGDACDSDADNDTILNFADNCKEIANPGQEDTDNDGTGDACDLSPGEVTADEPPVSMDRCWTGRGESVIGTDVTHRVKIPGIDQDAYEMHLHVTSCKGNGEATAKFLQNSPPTVDAQVLPTSMWQEMLLGGARYWLPIPTWEYKGEWNYPASVSTDASGVTTVRAYSDQFKACGDVPAAGKVIKLGGGTISKLVSKFAGDSLTVSELVNKLPRWVREKVISWVVNVVLYKVPDNVKDAIKDYVADALAGKLGIDSYCKTVWEPDIRVTLYPDGRDPVVSTPTQPGWGLESYRAAQPGGV